VVENGPRIQKSLLSDSVFSIVISSSNNPITKYSVPETMTSVKQLFLVCLYLFSVLLTSTVMADKPAGYPFLSFDKALQQSAVSSKPVFVYFGRYGCGYCDKTNKEAFSNEQVRKLYTSHYILAYVDAESGKRVRLPSGERITERDIGTRYNAFVTPVFSFLTSDGKVINRMIGVQRVVDLIKAHETVQQKIQQAGK